MWPWRLPIVTVGPAWPYPAPCHGGPSTALACPLSRWAQHCPSLPLVSTTLARPLSRWAQCCPPGPGAPWPAERAGLGQQVGPQQQEKVHLLHLTQTSETNVLGAWSQRVEGQQLHAPWGPKALSSGLPWRGRCVQRMSGKESPWRCGCSLCLLRLSRAGLPCGALPPAALRSRPERCGASTLWSTWHTRPVRGALRPQPCLRGSRSHSLRVGPTGRTGHTWPGLRAFIQPLPSAASCLSEAPTP